MAADLTSDGCSNSNPVYIATSGGSLMSIFPTSYTIKNNCKLIGSPVESGETRFDHKVKMPTTITFTGILKEPKYSEIASLKKSIDAEAISECKCTFYGKAGTAENMIIEAFEEIGDKNRLDAVEVRVSLREYLIHESS